MAHVSCVGVGVLQRGNTGAGCDLASTLCRYDLRKGDLFVLSWACLGSAGGVCSILLLPLVARYQDTIDVHMYVYGACLFFCLL